MTTSSTDHAHSPTEAYASLVRTFPDLTAWSLDKLLAEYAALATQRREAVMAADDDRLSEFANEIERRTFDRDTHVCRMGGVGIDELYALSIGLGVGLVDLMATVAELAKADR